jgi:hypothetical protein
VELSVAGGASVVDEDVDGSEGLRCGPDEGRRLIGVGGVAHVGGSCTHRELSYDRAQWLGIEVAEDDGRALTCQP